MKMTEPSYVRWKTLRSFDDVVEAEIFNSFLEASGIQVRLLGVHLASLRELGASDLLRLQVDERDWPRALALILQREPTPKRLSPLMDKAFLATLLSVFFPPLLLWSTWLIYRSYQSDEKPKRAGRRLRTLFANALVLCASVAFIIITRA